MKLDNNEYINQEIIYDENNKIDLKKSKTLKVFIPDTIQIGRNVGNVIYDQHFNGSDVFVCIGYGINSNFENLNNIRIDTFYSKNIKDRWFGIEFNSTGNKIIRGFIYEKKVEANFTKNIDDRTSSAILKEHNVYFQKEVFVKK